MHRRPAPERLEPLGVRLTIGVSDKPLSSVSKQRNPAGPTGYWFALLVLLVLCGEGLAYAACRLANVSPSQPAGWEILVAVAALIAGIGTVLLSWLVLHRYGQLAAEVETLRPKVAAGQEYQEQLASRAEQQRRLRHDIRGALSPALLMADRLLGNADPAVKRAGEIMVRCVDRAALLLADPVEAKPPDDP